MVTSFVLVMELVGEIQQINKFGTNVKQTSVSQKKNSLTFALIKTVMKYLDLFFFRYGMADGTRYSLSDPFQFGPSYLTPHLLFLPWLEVFPGSYLSSLPVPRNILLDPARIS